MAAMGLRRGDSGVSPTHGYIASVVFAAGQAYLFGVLLNTLPVGGVAGALGVGAGLWFVTGPAASPI